MATLSAGDVKKMVEATGTPWQEALCVLEVACASCIFEMTNDIDLAKAYLGHVQKFHDLLLQTGT